MSDLNQKNYNKLFVNITENLKSHEIVKEYKNNNINKIRLETYRDFIISLCNNIGDTFLGHEYIKTRKNKRDHFKWAFNKVCDDFIEEGLNFKDNYELFDYFFEYFLATFYDNDIDDIDFLIDYWEETLEYSLDKTRSDIEGMIEVYKIFDISINNKLNLETI